MSVFGRALRGVTLLGSLGLLLGLTGCLTDGLTLELPPGMDGQITEEPTPAQKQQQAAANEAWQQEKQKRLDFAKAQAAAHPSYRDDGKGTAIIFSVRELPIGESLVDQLTVMFASKDAWSQEFPERVIIATETLLDGSHTRVNAVVVNYRIVPSAPAAK